jgi:cell division protein FtsL
MQLRGRHWVVLWLIAFLVVATIVIGRQTRAHLVAGELREARERRRVLEAEMAELTRAIQQASSRDVISGKAGALGMRVATGAEITVLPAPGAVTRDR